MLTTDSVNEIIGPAFGECPQHGRYAVEQIQAFGRSWPCGRCPVCEAAQQAIEVAAWKRRETARQAAGLAERILRSGIPFRFQAAEFGNFRATDPRQDHVVRALCALVEGRTPPRFAGLLCLGACGTGKTHLAVACVRTVINRGLDGRYETAAGLIRRIRSTWGKDGASEITLLGQLERLALLVIDELGVQHASDSERAILTEVINSRYNAERPTILISNLPLPEFTAVVGERIIDRFKEGKILVFDWRGYREGLGKALREGIEWEKESAS